MYQSGVGWLFGVVFWSGVAWCLGLMLVGVSELCGLVSLGAGGGVLE